MNRKHFAQRDFWRRIKICLFIMVWTMIGTIADTVLEWHDDIQETRQGHMVQFLQQHSDPVALQKEFQSCWRLFIAPISSRERDAINLLNAIVNGDNKANIDALKNGAILSYKDLLLDMWLFDQFPRSSLSEMKLNPHQLRMFDLAHEACLRAAKHGVSFEMSNGTDFRKKVEIPAEQAAIEIVTIYSDFLKLCSSIVIDIK